MWGALGGVWVLGGYAAYIAHLIAIIYRRSSRYIAAVSCFFFFACLGMRPGWRFYLDLYIPSWLPWKSKVVQFLLPRRIDKAHNIYICCMLLTLSKAGVARLQYHKRGQSQRSDIHARWRLD